MPNFPITNAYRERYQQPPLQQGQPGMPGQMPQGGMPQPNAMAMQHANPNARFMRPPGQMEQGQPPGLGQPGMLPPQGMMLQPRMGQGQPMNPYLARLMAFRGQ